MTTALEVLVPTRTVQSAGLHRVRPVPPAGAAGVTLQWLGQAGFLVRTPATTLLIDPYLSDSLARKYDGTLFPHRRLHEAPVVADELRDVDIVLHSHAHTDHLDPETVAGLERRNSPTYLAPRARRDVALQRHIPADRLVPVTAGDAVSLCGVQVRVVPAAHEDLTTDERGDHVFLGYVVEITAQTGDRIRLYHSGDCTPYDGQAELLASLDVDVALLPVNGRDAHRLANGVPGNFSLEEAAELCRRAGVPELVCHHFGLFGFNTVAPRDLVTRLVRGAGDLAWTVPAVGATFHLTKEPA